MRFLHTGDWHLGRTIRGRSRIDEMARVLDEVADIAMEERADAVLIAGDTFDAFSPPADAQRLLYETLSRLARDGIRTVMIAGNHDSAPRMDAMSDILELAGVHCVGSLPADSAYRALHVPSRDGSEMATVVAVPWIPERLAVRYEALFGPPDAALEQYAANMQRALRFYCRAFAPGTVNVLLGHMMVSGVSVREGSGERRLHIGDAFAVLGSTLPASAQYIALGHLHRPQPVPQSPVEGGSFYAGSLVQLDFGEAGQQKSVRIADVKAGLPASTREVPLTRGTTLRDVRITLDELPQHGDRYGGDYLRVEVVLDGPPQNLYDRVREVLPNAVDVRQVRTQPQGEDRALAAPVQSMEPHELVGRYYRESYGSDMPEAALALFRALHEEELHASA